MPDERAREHGPLRGALAAGVTPLRSGGAALDEDAFAPLVSFLASGGLDGILALGTTGEGILLSSAERKRAAELFSAARPPGFTVAVHCGAQTTAETAELAEHAAASGADAVAVIGPPYYALDVLEMLAHFRTAADACAPLPFYVYEFAARSGYTVPIAVVEQLRELCPNMRGLKVSDSPFEAVRPYLSLGLDVFVGQESLALEALEHGAAGVVSGLGTAFPEIVARLAGKSEEAHAAVTAIRGRLQALPFQATLKAILSARGLPVRPDVRAPLRTLSQDEGRAALDLVRETLAH